jgi:hypothetical protein
MYEERHGYEENDGFDSRRYGNRRKELSRLKVVERRKDRKKHEKELRDGNTTNRPVEASRSPWA